MSTLSQAPSIDDRSTGRLARWWSSSLALPLLVAVIDFLAHLAFSNNYGYFRDELYYIAAGQHE